MWYFWEVSNGKFCVMCEMQEKFVVRGKKKPGRPKKTWKMQVEKESKSVGLEKKDAMNRARC